MTATYLIGEKPTRIGLSLCPIDAIDLEGALQQVRGLSQSSRYHYVVTPNIDHLQRLYKDKYLDDLHDIYLGASLSLCDSRVLKLIAPLIGISIPEVVPGSTLTKSIFDTCLTSKDKVLIIGGEEVVIRSLKNQYEHLKIDHINPSMGFIKRSSEVDAIIHTVCDLRPNFIFIAVGSPRQEILAKKIGAYAEGGVALCVGASLLFMTGKEKRAPEWMQAISCEWLYRMIRNPRRLIKRYLLNFLHLPGIIHALRQSRDTIGDARSNG